MPSELCLGCGRILDKFWRDQQVEWHPTCQPMTLEELGKAIQEDITDVIRWTDNNSARSQQAAIGPSELGTACDRKIAYRMAGVAEVNQWMDPLPAIVGTSVHQWLEKAVNRFQAIHHMDRWETEITIQPDPLVTGHCDLYDRDKAMVLDFKTVSPTKLKEWKRKGPPAHYIDQVNLYAKGLLLTGRKVTKVALMAIPRSGWLREIQTWVGDYDPGRAQSALDRMYAIGNKLIEMGSEIVFEQIEGTPGPECSYCPWYRGGEGEAVLSGCSGNVAVAKEKFMKGLVRGQG